MKILKTFFKLNSIIYYIFVVIYIILYQLYCIILNYLFLLSYTIGERVGKSKVYYTPYLSASQLYGYGHIEDETKNFLYRPEPPKVETSTSNT